MIEHSKTNSDPYANKEPQKDNKGVSSSISNLRHSNPYDQLNRVSPFDPDKEQDIQRMLQRSSDSLQELTNP